MNEAIVCRKGDTCRFTVQIGEENAGLDPRFDRARFTVRDAWENHYPTLLSVSEGDGIEFDYTSGIVTVTIGAELTKLLHVTKPRGVAAQLRLYNSNDANDRISWPIKFLLTPTVIGDE